MTPDPARPPIARERPFWWTGTSEDQFTEIYVHFQTATRLHGRIDPAGVDAMGLSVVGALMGVGHAEFQQKKAHAGLMGGPDVVMVPKVRTASS